MDLEGMDDEEVIDDLEEEEDYYYDISTYPDYLLNCYRLIFSNAIRRNISL